MEKDDYADQWNEDEDKGVVQDAVAKAKAKAERESGKGKLDDEFVKAYAEDEAK